MKGGLPMETYERVKELRKKHLKLSQTAFGEKLGVSRSVINNIELNALAKPEQKLPLLKLICEKFNVNEDWLLNGTGEMLKSTTTEEDYIAMIDKIMDGENETAKNLFKAFAKFDIQDWIALQRMIDKYNDANSREINEPISNNIINKDTINEEEQISKYDAVPKTPAELEALYLRPAVKKNGTDEK